MSENTTKNTGLHPRNKHKGHYDFDKLIEVYPSLKQFVGPNKYGNISIDFFNPDAVKTLNKALLKLQYGISMWEIPSQYLCPPVPGRADYIHHIADLLKEDNQGGIPTGKKYKCLDIGTGANCIYPIIGVTDYKWTFVATDVDKLAIKTATVITAANPSIKGKIAVRHQADPQDIIHGAIQEGETYELTICNPPFHASMDDAEKGTKRKLKNLGKGKVDQSTLNFGGKSNELWCEGGEQKFVKEMVRQSKYFGKSCMWFSTLISKEANLGRVYQSLKDANAIDVKTLPMGQGNKKSRIVAWSFLTSDQRKDWMTAKK